MAYTSTSALIADAEHPAPGALLHYIEEMLLELAQLAASVGESGLAASLAIATIQAGAAGERRRAPPTA